MGDFKFDHSANFNTNLESFLNHLESLDPEMTTILRANIDKLEGVVDESKRTSIRGIFNESILAELENMISTEKDEKG